MKRRDFLKSSSAFALTPVVATPIGMASIGMGFVHPTKNLLANEGYHLTAEKISAPLFDGAPPLQAWGLNGQTPGPVIRAKKGDRLKIAFDNQLPSSTTIHWHGIRIDNAMDGVPILTQPPIERNESFLYDFIVPDAGTYWYHSHKRQLEQVARGLYGPLIIDEDNPPDIDHDIIAMIDDWRLRPDGSLDENFNNIHDLSHEGRLGNVAKAIFVPTQPKLKQGERVRLRLINVATDRLFHLEIKGGDGRLVALDGMPLISPRPFGRRPLILAPAQRADIMLDLDTDALEIIARFRQDSFSLGKIAVNQNGQKRRESPIPALPQNDMRPLNLNQAIHLDLELDGGAMRMGMMNGMMRRRGANADNPNLWSINGVFGLPKQPFHSFKRNQTATITLINKTMFDHGIHFHGHHFQTINASGNLGPYRDTILVRRGEEETIACLFENVGKWLIHCHMLSHETTGMATWFEVA